MTSICVPHTVDNLKGIHKKPAHLREILFNDDDIMMTLPISENGFKYPHGFESWKEFESHVSTLMKTVFIYDPDATVSFYGSAVQGYRLKHKKGKGIWFDESSYYDIAIASPKLYSRAMRKHPNRVCKRDNRTYPIPSYTKDRIFSHLYSKLKGWPRNTTITFYKDLSGILSNCLLSLHIKIGSDGLISETYLFGKDIYNNRIIGDAREVLVKYGTNYVDCENEYNDSP